jgi:cation:H+ antiporter
MIARVRLDWLLVLGLSPAHVPGWILPTLVFAGALGITLFAAAQYTRLLERLTEHEHFSLELLGFLGALGANIPNYVASLAAFFGGYGLLGIGIIVGSNIYNVAVILALAALATPGRRGIVLGKLAAREVRHLAWLVAYMGSAVLLLVVLGTSLVPGYQAVQVVLNLLIIGLFALVVRDALRRDSPTETEKASENPHPWESEGLQTVVAAGKEDDEPSLPLRTILLAMVALGITLFGVIIMVQAAEVSATQLQLSSVILSLVVLAVATSLPNTVVAYQLARTEGGSTSVEEILSSNAINLTLGVAVPLLVWPMRVPAGLLTELDLPLLAALGLLVVACVSTRRIPRWVGLGLFAVYVTWIVLHLLR